MQATALHATVASISARIPPHPPRGQGQQIKLSSDTLDRFALLIDGDIVGPAHWPSLVDAVRSKGELTVAYVFGAPRKDNRDHSWQKDMTSLGIEFKAVPRKAGGAKVPNDMAIAMHASRLVSENEALAIALAVNDVDYVYVAQLSTLGS
jgi:Protein of unknown function DUF88.